MRSELIHKIFGIETTPPADLIMQVFRYQYQHNTIYKQFCDLVNRAPDSISAPSQIPYLPIGFFKSHAVITGEFEAQTWFESSGTTGQITSKHHIRSLEIYEESFNRCFSRFYGSPADWCVIGLLPSYLERSHSSLVYMVNSLINASTNPQSGFYLYDFQQLADTIRAMQEQKQKVLLFGVSFALLDFAASFPMEMEQVTIIETGGMKGRKKELTRNEMHEILALAFPGASIHSEYGMTELLSQAYADDTGRFFCAPWMHVTVREEDDPFQTHTGSATGVINILDLANIDSCAFIATDDIGKIYADGGFEVLGRLDNSDVRGCSLLAI